MQSLSATAGALVGLSSVVSADRHARYDIRRADRGRALVAAIVVAAWRGWRPRAMFWGAAATLIVIWVAASVSNFGPFARPPSDPRYLSSDVALLLVCVCVALPRPRLARPGIIVAGIVLAVVSATNAAQYSQTHSLLGASDVASRAELGALKLLRGVVPPQFSPALPGDPAVLVNVQAAPFFSAVDSFGIIADSPATLLAQDETTRERADGVLERGELSLAPATGAEPAPTTTPSVLSGAPRVRGRCLVVGSKPLDIRAPAGKYELTAAKGAPITVSMGRFSSIYAAQLGSVPAASRAIVSVPADRAPQIPWR